MVIKRTFSTVLLVLLIAILLLPGCNETDAPTTYEPQKSQQTSTPTVTQKSQPASPTEIQTTPSPTSVPQTTSTIAPNVAMPTMAKFDISKAPKVGETVNLTFTLNITGLVKPITKVWLEFERYDPALFYPLGKRKAYLNKIKSVITPANPDYAYLKQALKEQPQSVVPPESVVLTGNTIRQGEPLKPGEQVKFDTTVRFPQEGEWLVNACFYSQVDGEQVRDELHLTVNKESGRLGWQEDFAWSNHVLTAPERPVSIFVKVPRAPLLGENFPLTIYAESTKDLNNVEIFLEFIKMDGAKSVKIPVSDVMVSGESSWQANLVSGVPTSFSRTIKLPQEGDWKIGVWIRKGEEILKVGLYSIFLHIGKEASRYGWPVSHDPPSYDPLRPGSQ